MSWPKKTTPKKTKISKKVDQLSLEIFQENHLNLLVLVLNQKYQKRKLADCLLA